MRLTLPHVIFLSVTITIIMFNIRQNLPQEYMVAYYIVFGCVLFTIYCLADRKYVLCRRDMLDKIKGVRL